jgi:predicted dehydrogenase
MDVGFYATHMFRAVSQSEPRVLAARVKLASKDVDRFAEADVEFDGGTGRIRCSLWSWHMFDISMRVVGERGELRAFNPIAPQFPHSLKVKLDGKTRKEKVPGEPTYTLQLRAFAASCLRGAPVLTDADDAVKNQRVVDAIYAAAGLPLREPGK